MPQTARSKPDPRGLTFIGAGKEGRVYRLDGTRCIKYYRADKYRHRELAALRRGQGNPLLPQVFEWGPGYVIREYIEGVPLFEHLSSHGLTRELTEGILRLHETLIRLGYRRADLRLAHVILTPDGRLRIIDPTNMMKVDRIYPRKLLRDLDSLGLKEEFLAWVERLRPGGRGYWRNPPGGK